ncbi:MAG: hypothetical protein IKP87_04665 [Victivallales bacterium]|nr:hypothetical protein [Victivallales bacterium]
MFQQDEELRVLHQQRIRHEIAQGGELDFLFDGGDFRAFKECQIIVIRQFRQREIRHFAACFVQWNQRQTQFRHG